MFSLAVLGALAIASSAPLLLFALLSGRERNLRVNRTLMLGLAVPADARKAQLASPVSERALAPALRRLAHWGRRLTPAGVAQSTERRVRLAGEVWTAEQVTVAKIAFVAMAAGMSILRAVAEPSPAAVLLVPAAVVIGVLVPDSILARRGRERQAKILMALPDTLDQLTVCVEAGLAFDAALMKVASTSRGPLGDELRRVLQDIQIGLPRRDALDRLLDRTDVVELRQLVHAIRQAESYGVPVAAVLKTQSVDLRQKRSIKAEERAQKMPVKLVFPLVFCILPTLFIAVLGPAVLRVHRVFG